LSPTPEPNSAWPSSVGLVGSGAMGRAMLAGLVRAAPARGAACVVADAIPAAAERGAAEVGGSVGSIAQAAACELVVVAVKPKDAADALAELAPHTGSDTVVISVIAGWDMARLRAAAPGVAVVRTMPNLAVRFGAGLVALATDGVDAARREALERVLAPLGAVVPLPESLFPAATALAGSGPGLMALIVEAFEDGGVATGLTRDQARAMARAVLVGTAALLSDDDADPAVLRQQVSSPAGTTIAGLMVLERGSVRAHVADAIVAAARRAAEL
jgi:pyrroline-5-carboxylate reductase